MLRAAIYARTSHDPHHRARSTESQVASCRRDVEEHADWELVGTYVDDDRSASSRATKAREDFAVLEERIANGEIDVVVVWELSRATRDLEFYVRLERTLAEHGVLLSYQGQTYDLTRAGDRRRVASDAVEARHEADRTSERALRSQARNAELGRPQGPTPYGYRRVYDVRTGELLRQEPDEIDKDHPDGRAPVVRAIVDGFLAGESLNALALTMQRRGLPTPKPPRATTGSPRGWTAATVGQLLRQPAIAGLRKHTRNAETTYYRAQWEAIITADERERILAILRDPNRVYHRGVEPVHLLSHLAVCAYCGVPVAWKIKRQKGVQYTAYACMKSGCGGVYVQSRPADDVVTQAVLARLSHPDAIAQMTDSDRATATSRMDARARVVELERQMAELLAEFRAQRLSAAAYAAAATPLERDIEAARSATQTRVIGRVVVRLATSEDVAETWVALPVPEKREVIRSLFEVRLHRAEVKGARRWDPRRVELIPR